MASQLSSETLAEKNDEKMNTIAKAKVIPPPLSFNEDTSNSGRHRSCTIVSLESSSCFSLSTTANTTPGTPYPVTPTHHQHQNHTIHRPRAILPSSMSFDSGVEISPLFQLGQFRYGESAVAATTGGGDQLNTSSVSAAAVSGPPVFGSKNNDVSGLMNNVNTNTGLNDLVDALDDSIEGFDEEVNSFNHHHFTPISVFTASDTSSLDGRRHQTAEVFRFPSVVVPGATGNGNLATERHANRLQQRYSAADYYSQQLEEVNNNDPSFRNLNHGGSAPAPATQEMMFNFDEDGDGDDDVFYNGNAAQDEYEEDSPPMRESRSWHITRPSCIIGGGAVDENFEENETEIASRSALFSTSSSRRSSSPIPIPTTGRSSRSTSMSSCHFESFFEGAPMASTMLSPPPSSQYHSRRRPSEVEETDDLIGSVPMPVTRMPYYHEMAPRLIANRKEEEVTDSSVVVPTTSHRRTDFGTHFATSCSIITRSLVPSRFSPVPFHGRWYPNPQSVQRGHLNQKQTVQLKQTGALRFGRLPASPTYPLRVISTDFRALTPHFEVDEPAEETTASSSYELVFNFSQLSVNEISGEVMDIEVADGATGDDLHRQGDDSSGSLEVVPKDVSTPQQSTAVSTSSSFNSTASSSSNSTSNSSSSPPPLPDIVSSHRSASFRQRSAVAAASKHVHRNTLPSFNVEHISASVINHHHQSEPRRTMSVSLPIEEEVISHVASQLRQIADDFSSSRQIIRHSFNPLSSLSPVFDLLAGAFLFRNIGGSSSHFSSSTTSRTSATITRRQTFHGGNRTSRVSSSRVSTNDGLTASPPPTPITTGNSTFYVGTTTANSTASSAKTKGGGK